MTARLDHGWRRRHYTFPTNPTIPNEFARNTEGIAGDKQGRVVHRRSALKLPLLLGAGAALGRAPHAAAETGGRWSPDRANRWYQAQGWLVGSNYIPATAINQLEMFQADTFDLRRIDTELGWARYYGHNTARVFLHDQLWAQDQKGFQTRLAQFVGVAAQHRIKPLFVFFDSCWDPAPRAGRQRAPRPGIHNSGWVQSPGAERLGDAQYLSVMRDYVTGVLTQFRNDPRILGWDLWNEPDNPARQYRSAERTDKEQLVVNLLPQVFQWARAVDPSQPLTSGVWHGDAGDPQGRNEISDIQLANADVITFHSYAAPAGFESRINELAPLGRPIICTEYMARTRGSTVGAILPLAKRHNVGAINWGLVTGKTQTYFPWDSWDHPYPAVPKVWFHDLLGLDGRPFAEAEVQAMRTLAAGQA